MVRVLSIMLLSLGLAAVEAHAAKPTCGDDICSGAETAASCPVDCASGGSCGDGTCDSGESCSSCESDCGVCPPADACNNDGICSLGEDCTSCPGDCAGVLSGKKSDRYCCGGASADDLFCDEGLCGLSCGTPIEPVCGDGIVEGAEQCDDANTIDGDGCSSVCTDEPLTGCGNGVLDVGERCDDGNTLPGDGCSSVCTVEPFCGDGVLDPDEQCDDGNTDDGDGCSALCEIELPGSAVPTNQFNIGDSIGEAEAADGSIGSINHESVWSTGYSGTDIVDSLNERFEAAEPAAYHENDANRDPTFNKAISGSVMADFETQANQVVADTAATPSGAAGHISILLGANDVCADTIGSMTDIAVFESQYRAGLEALASSEATRLATIHVSSLPAIYWLWESRADTSPFSWCRLFAWPNVPCQNLLASSGDDCESVASREDPDTVYAGDGQNCQRRKVFHARIRDEYNAVLENVAAEFATRENLPLPAIEYVDIFDVRFDAVHVNGGDCFHPSYQGQDLLSDEQYCGSSWGQGDPACAL